MCKNHNPRVIDKCMRNLCENISPYLGKDVKIVACCCGHGKYPMTLIVKYSAFYCKDIIIQDWCSHKLIPRKKRFYVKDKAGFYYVPETIEVEYTIASSVGD